MSLSALIATLLDNLKEVSESTNRLGKPNWSNLGSKDRCWRCGQTFGEEIEPGSEVRHHLIPTSEGGSDTADNESLLCSNCHSVVHKFYISTAKIGKTRTRTSSGRLLADFGAIQIHRIMKNPENSLSQCEVCDCQGTVVGVTEGYWNGEGMLVFLACLNCGHKFGVPFIGTIESPPIDPVSAISLALSGSAKTLSSDIPLKLRVRWNNIMKKLKNELADFRREHNSSLRNLTRMRALQADVEKKSESIKLKYIKRISRLLPEASRLQEECKQYRKS